MQSYCRSTVYDVVQSLASTSAREPRMAIDVDEYADFELPNVTLATSLR